MNIFACVACQISLDIFFNGRMAFRSKGVAQIADRRVAMAVKGLVRVGDADTLRSHLEIGLVTLPARLPYVSSESCGNSGPSPTEPT